MNNIYSMAVNRILPIVLLLTLMTPTSLMATGPRVAPSLFSPEAEVFALDFRPFITTEITGGGPVSEIVDTVFKREGIDAVITPLPLQRMVKYYLSQENAIAVIGRYFDFSKKEKKDLIFVPVFVSSEHYYYYKPAHKKAISWNGELKNLKGYTYGAQQGEGVAAYKAAGINVRHGRTVSLLKKLKSGKVDFVSVPDLAAEWLFNRYFKREKNNFVQMNPVVGEVPLYVIFNKRHPKGEATAAKFINGLDKILATGSYDEILAKHLGDRDSVQAHRKRLEETRKSKR